MFIRLNLVACKKQQLLIILSFFCKHCSGMQIAWIVLYFCLWLVSFYRIFYIIFLKKSAFKNGKHLIECGLNYKFYMKMKNWRDIMINAGVSIENTYMFVGFQKYLRFH
jgi:hypothetical protein